jgi:hypothetical protein
LCPGEVHKQDTLDAHKNGGAKPVNGNHVEVSPVNERVVIKYTTKKQTARKWIWRRPEGQVGCLLSPSRGNLGKIDKWK